MRNILFALFVCSGLFSRADITITSILVNDILPRNNQANIQLYNDGAALDEISMSVTVSYNNRALYTFTNSRLSVPAGNSRLAVQDYGALAFQAGNVAALIRDNGYAIDGDYAYCIKLYTAGNEILAEECETYAQAYGVDITGVSPEEGLTTAEITEGPVTFCWTGNLPASSLIVYRLRICPVTGSQSDLEAITENTPVYTQTVAGTTCTQVSGSIFTFLSTNRYVWIVEAMLADEAMTESGNGPVSYPLGASPVYNLYIQPEQLIEECYVTPVLPSENTTEHVIRNCQLLLDLAEFTADSIASGDSVEISIVAISDNQLSTTFNERLYARRFYKIAAGEACIPGTSYRMTLSFRNMTRYIYYKNN